MIIIWYCYYEYREILFEIANIKAAIKNNIKKILAKKFDILIIIYINDIFIFIDKKSHPNSI